MIWYDVICIYTIFFLSDEMNIDNDDDQLKVCMYDSKHTHDIHTHFKSSTTFRIDDIIKNQVLLSYLMIKINQ